MPWIANIGHAAAEQWEPDGNTVCISITEPGIKARLPKFVDMIRENFQDYDSAKAHPENAVLFSGTQAARIARFARKHRENNRNILVHCAAGISRSGAVADALLQAFPEYEDKGWPRHPNGHVKSLMKRALGLVPLGFVEQEYTNNQP